MNEVFDTNLREIYATFGRVQLIPILKVAEFLGRYWRTLVEDETFPIKKVGRNYFVPAVKLARWLSC